MKGNKCRSWENDYACLKKFLRLIKFMHMQKLTNAIIKGGFFCLQTVIINYALVSVIISHFHIFSPSSLYITNIKSKDISLKCGWGLNHVCKGRKSVLCIMVS